MSTGKPPRDAWMPAGVSCRPPGKIVVLPDVPARTNAAGVRSATPAAPIAFAPPGLTGQTAGGVALAQIVNGLTLVQHWTAALEKVAK